MTKLSPLILRVVWKGLAVRIGPSDSPSRVWKALVVRIGPSGSPSRVERVSLEERALWFSASCERVGSEDEASGSPHLVERVGRQD